MKLKSRLSPTQKLRDLIDDAAQGLAASDDLHNALLELERELQLPLTASDEDRTAA